MFRMSRLSRILFLGAIAVSGLPAFALAEEPGSHDVTAAMPPLKPSITRLHGPYAGIIGGGQSVSVGQNDGVTGIRNHRASSLAGLVAGYQWRTGTGAAPAFWGVEADIVSLDLLRGDDPVEPDWLATLRVRYGINLVGNLVVYGTAGLAAAAGNGASTGGLPGLAAGAGLENSGPHGIRTRLEYLYANGLGREDSHQVRAALLVSLR